MAIAISFPAAERIGALSGIPTAVAIIINGAMTGTATSTAMAVRIAVSSVTPAVAATITGGAMTGTAICTATVVPIAASWAINAATDRSKRLFQLSISRAT